MHFLPSRISLVLLAGSFLAVEIALVDSFSTNPPSRLPSDLYTLSLPTDNTKVRYRCRVSYDGTDFSGFQFQNGNKRTVQGVLEEVLRRRFDRPIRVQGAGRTDAGVHARGQAIHFDLQFEESEPLKEDWNQQLQRAMNSMLPTDVRVWNVGPAPPPCDEFVNDQTRVYAWNVMRKCNAKLYSYRICLADSMDPIERHSRWQLDRGHEIDPNELCGVLKRYEGTHDFVCFAGALEANARKSGKKMTTVRTVHQCTLIEEDAEKKLYRIDIYLDGALYKMVRNIVGTALDVCRGRVDEATFKKFLNPSEDGLVRDNNSSLPAPPQGLTLERVFYPDDLF